MFAHILCLYNDTIIKKILFLKFSSVGNNRDVSSAAGPHLCDSCQKLRQEDANTPLTATVEINRMFSKYNVFLAFTIHTFYRENLFFIHTFVSNELTPTNTVLLCKGL